MLFRMHNLHHQTVLGGPGATGLPHAFGTRICRTHIHKANGGHWAQESAQQVSRRSWSRPAVATESVIATEAPPCRSTSHLQYHQPDSIPYASASSKASSERAQHASTSSAHPASDSAAHAPESKHLRQLTRAIQACSSWQQLQQLYSTHRSSLNHIHTCCLLESLARVAPGAAGAAAGLCPEAQQEVVYLAQHLEELSGQQLAACEPRHLANLLHSFAQLSFSPRSSWLDAWQPALLAALPAARMRDLAITAWSLGTLSMPRSAALLQQLLPAAGGPALHGANSQDVANLLWACAQLGQQPCCAVLRPLLLKAVQLLPSFRPAELSCLAWALGKLQVHPGDALLGRIMAQAGGPMAGANAREAVMLLWGCASLGCAPHARTVTAAVRVLEQQLHSCSGADIGSGLWALQKMGYPLDPELLTRCGDRSLQLMHSMQPNDINLLCYVLARQGVRPPGRWRAAVLQRVQHTLGRFEARQLCDLLSSLAVLRVELSDAWLEDVSAALLQHLPQCSGRTLVKILWSLGKYRCHVGKGWWRAYSAALQDKAGEMDSAMVASLVWGVARIGVQPSGEELACLLGLVQQQLASMSSRDMHRLVWALGQLLVQQRGQQVQVQQQADGPAAGSSGDAAGCVDGAVLLQQWVGLVRALWARSSGMSDSERDAVQPQLRWMMYRLRLLAAEIGPVQQQEQGQQQRAAQQPSAEPQQQDEQQVQGQSDVQQQAGIAVQAALKRPARDQGQLVAA